MKKQKAKKPSGAQFKRQRAEREARARLEEEERRQASGQSSFASQLAALSSPPRDVVGGMEWSYQATVMLLYQVLTDPAIDEDKRRKQAAELARALGMISTKALYESRLKRIEKTLYGGPKREDANGSDGLERDPTTGSPLPV